MTTSSLPTGIGWRYLVAGRVRFPIEPILLTVSLTTLCFVFIVVFSDSDNATRLFVGGDGARAPLMSEPWCVSNTTGSAFGQAI